MNIVGKRGRPRRYALGEKLEYFGMKLTTSDKLKIKALAAITKKPACDALMELVNIVLDNKELYMVNIAKRISTRELLLLSPKERSILLKKHAKNLAALGEVDEYNEDIIE